MTTFTLPKLSFDYSALEPHFDAKTMEIHHQKHHAGYVVKANAALEGTAFEGKSACEILENLDKIPAEKRTAVRNNAGGACNHAFFWSILTPTASDCTGDLLEAIKKEFGSLENMKTEFEAAAKTRFGSGWAWLVIKNGKLEVISTANQDSPLSLGYKRLIGLDVWEHAYYLHYQNRRPDYVSAFWNVLNWEKVSEYFAKGGV